MSEKNPPNCPECEAMSAEHEALDRRNFFRVAGGSAAALSLAASVKVARADQAPVAKPAKPAEDLVKELYQGLSEEQKKAIVLPWDHGSNGGKDTPTRGRMYNGPVGRKIGDIYTKPQQELVERILRAISSDEDGYRKMTRNGTFDGSGSLQGCGATIFGDPSGGQKYCWLFTGHHLTVRCDGNSEEGAAFGGPMYYGHSPNGYSDRNCFFYQTKTVLSVFDALSEKQRTQAVVTGSPGEQLPSVRFRKPGEAHPGLHIGELSADQRGLVQKVMRDILSPYRKEDADEVMDILRANGGLEKVHLAFYQDAKMNDQQRWHFWRLEGPGFVWNYRVLPHVHTFVNISSKI